MSQSDLQTRLNETVSFLHDRLGQEAPDFAMVLGSGLGGFGEEIEDAVAVPYEAIPHFKGVGVVGHKGRLIAGKVAGKRVLCQQGRYHFYEGHSIQDVVYPIRVMAALGAKKLIVTNAAGGINTGFRVGDIMVIRDHINFQGTNPLMGANHDDLGPRFPDMTYAYHPEFRVKIQAVAADLGQELQDGVYLAVSGPSYETPAEIKAFQVLGADAVGMSTVPEVIAANHMGLQVLGLSCISNAAAADGGEKLDHSHVAEVINAMGSRFQQLVTRFIAEV